MKRTVLYLIRHPEYRTQSLADLGREAWETVGVEEKRVFAYYLQEALAEIEADELIVCDDSLAGPFRDPAGLLDRIDSVKGDWWRLAGDAPMLGLRNRLWTREDVAAALASAEPIKALAGLLGEGPELYDTASMASLTAHPMLDEPVRMAEAGCPFFAHEVFHRDYDDVIISNLGHQGMLFYRWMRRCAPEWIDPLWDFLLANFHQVDLYRNMHLKYVLPSGASPREAVRARLKKRPLLLVMHLYYPDKLAESRMCAARFPRETDVCITTNTEEKARQIREMFAPLGFNSLEVRVIANRGRDVSSLLVGAADLVERHDIVCFFHDKKVLQTKPGSIGLGFADKLIENLFATEDYVINVVDLFDRNERLGILSPPAPHHSDYYFTQGVDWGPNYQLTRDLADRLAFRAPIAPDKMPIAPLGTCFWFRSEAMKPLLEHGWKYEDFPPEPNNPDGTLLHAIERIYPFAVVEAGFYPAYVLSDRWAKVEYSSLRYYVEGYNRICVKHGIMNYQRNMRLELIHRLRNGS